MIAVIIIKLLINAGVAIAFCVRGKLDLAMMFVGFAIADAGAFWVTLK
jgi:hypothetical protein